MEEVAKRAKVGKPTLYKWWPTKATLVLAMLCERMAPNLEKPTVLTAEESLRFRVRRLIDAFHGPFGKIVAGLIAEGQSEPAILQEFFDRWVRPRRNATIADLQRSKNAGELRSETEPELLNDAIFGAIYYRMLLHSGRLWGSARNWSSTSSVGTVPGLAEVVLIDHRSDSQPVGRVANQ
jgi:AcrR family transcriptional regulator